jgi:hypothetical protein
MFDITAGQEILVISRNLSAIPHGRILVGDLIHHHSLIIGLPLWILSPDKSDGGRDFSHTDGPNLNAG